MAKRRIVLTTIFTVICFAFMTVTSFAADNAVTVKNSADFMKVWKQIEKNYADDYDAVQNTTIKLDGNIDINDELSMALNGSKGLKVNLDLNGYALRGIAESPDYLFDIGKNLNLVIQDSSASQSGQVFILCKDGGTGSYDAVFRIADGGQLTLESGTFKGNEDTTCGMVQIDENGLFTMNGGTICDNRCSIIRHAVSWDECGSAVDIDDGKFVMNGGVIRDNTQWNDGAAVVVDTNNSNDVEGDFGFEMRGGLITNNTTCENGAGGVFIDDGRASFTGGVIKGNAVAPDMMGYLDVDNDATDILIDTGAESCYFGGDFVCEYNSQSELNKAISVKTSGFNSADAPEFGGSVHLDAILIEDGWYYDPGIVCKDIDTSPKGHAWIGLCEATENIKIYTDVDESSDHYATDTNLTKCFFTCALGEDPDRAGHVMHWDEDESMCAVYKDNALQYIGVVEADNHSEAPICLTSFNKEKFVDTDDIAIPDSKYGYSWDVKNRAHFVSTEAAVKTRNAIDWVDMEYAGGIDEQISSPVVIKEEKSSSGKAYDTVYSYEIKNTIRDGSKEYTRLAYNTLELTTARNAVESKVTMDPKEEYAIDHYRTGQTVKIEADYPKNSDCFKEWEISTDSKYKDAVDKAIPEEKRTEDVLTFEMPAVSNMRITAKYYPVYSIQGEGFTAYRIDGSEEIPVTDPLMAGKTVKLEANGLEELSWPRWIIYKLETDESGELVNKTDVTSELLGDGAIPESPEFAMPEYDIEVVCSEAGHTVVNSPYASVKVNSEEPKPAGKIAVPYSADTTLQVTLDESKIPEGHNFIGWDMIFIFTNGDEDADAGDAFAPLDGVKSFQLSFADICDYYGAGDLSAIREIRLTARYDKKIDFDANGGSGEMDADTHNPAYKYGLPACKFTAPEGQRFAGWAYEPDGAPMKVGHLISVEEDITLYAIWEEIPATVSVKLHANDGTDNTKTVKAASGEYLLPATTFEAPEDKAFAGWSFIANGEVIADKSIDLVYDTELYAIWKDADHHHVFDTTTVEPTCTAGGYDIHKCSCGETKTDNFTDPKGHDWGDYETLAPTGCGNKGVETRICKVCGLSETRVIEKTDHVFESDFTVDQKATTYSDGSMSRHCKNCDATTDSTVIPAIGAAVLADSYYTYNGSAKLPEVKLVDREGTELVCDTDFIVKYSDNINAGTATVVIECRGKYEGTIISEFRILKATPTLKITSSSRTAKYSSVKKKSIYLSALTVKGAKGTKSFRKVSGSSKLTITKSGKIKVKKGTKRGTYRIKVKAASASTANYKYASTTRTITVRVK